MNKYFCMSAWTHLHPLPDGKVIACCLSPMDQPVGDLNDNSLDEIWNGDRMRSLRQNMLAGKASPDICSRCYEKEDMGLTSLRTGMNEQYYRKYHDVVKTTKADGTVDDFNLIHWDFRFSNICNLKCRTCGPVFSSAWSEDFKELHYPEKDRKEYQALHPKVMKMIRDENHFWKVINPLFNTVEMIHFAGGEPLIMDEHYRIMNELTAREQFDVRIRYSTNCTQMNYRGIDVLKLWEPFRHIDLSLSIDAMGDRFSYIRSGGSWEETKANLERMRDYRDAGRIPGVKWFFHPTISIMNVFHVLDLHRYLLEERHIEVGRNYSVADHYAGDFILNPVIFPDHYNIQALPQTIKVRVREAYEKHAEWAYRNYGVPQEGLMNVVSHMENDDKSKYLADFFDITARLDQIRNEDIVNEFPEISDLFTTKWNLPRD